VDMLLFGEAVIDESDLEVPHRGITRPFNLEGLADLDSDLHIPGHGRVEDLLAAADRSGIKEVRALC
jgi:2-amino-4-hydroxy-6-hydroxymethyldihydropteridine diphosphokinase